MKIGIIGAGTVGVSLANGLVRHGHEVMLGTRDLAKPAVRDFVASGGGRGSAGSYSEAAAFGGVVITAFPGALLDETLPAIGLENLDGKLIIDAVNPVIQREGRYVPAFGEDESAAERIQRAVPTATVVKAFNTTAAARMIDPDPTDGPTTMPIAGDDAAAKAVVTELLTDAGWKVRDLGGLEKARRLEQQVADWVQRTFAGS